MAKAIFSIGDYSSHLTRKLRSIRHFERCLFSAWCADHLLATNAGLVRRELPGSDFQILREILDVIWEFLLDSSIPTVDVLNQLDNNFMQIDPEDPVVAIEGHPVVTEVMGAIGTCILACRRNDVRLAQSAGEIVINTIDYELDERYPDYAENSPAEMFTYPELKAELETQLAMIQHLRGQYVLNASLRTMFRA